MSKLRIVGGNKVFGTIRVECAKNSLLPILAASIMTKDKVYLKNITYYSDIESMIDILCHLGINIEKNKDYIKIDSTRISKYDIPYEMSNKLRASIFFLGPLLSVFGRARVAYPGGCNIGVRPIDIHLNGLKALGARVIEQHGYVDIHGENMRSGIVRLPFPSVGATENLIMASIFLKGQTTLFGVAKEPEVVDLCNFLNKLGAKITGYGADTIIIEGVNKLLGGEYEPIPDRIIAGTYLLLPLMCGGEIEITNIIPRHISPLIEMLNNNACKINVDSDKIHISSSKRPLSFGKIETLPYPHFPTDLQQPLCSVSTISNGTTIIVENMFENRFKHVGELIKLGANISVKDRVCVVEGVKELSGANVTATDLRGGAALVLAGLCAGGYTTIDNAEIIDRGYYKIEDVLSNAGINITRIN